MKVVENLQDDFDFNYKTLKSQGGKWMLETVKSPVESQFVTWVSGVVLMLCSDSGRGEGSLGAAVAKDRSVPQVKEVFLPP